ncbi:methionine--tRNA ligase [Clostridium oryzae]|uniref:Methionine--tRNA ligase n=1 Tax=Clostridium oryzae TaxID=1450648 RepID=A0A1V4ISC6_9CLOT|nr:methionine--tRNA ligase [Clostridium oryzae]OPJ62922.1 methionine--tRNA ligase [Clostridium oryzae]
MSIFIGGAWPYANGSLHLGHVTALLPGDILARYYRSKGEDVLYVSGSDCHGTPISIRAKKEGVEPKDIAHKYHEEFADCFNKLGFTYDLYTRTDDQFHKEEVKRIFTLLYENGYIYEKEQKQLFCANCNQFLPDRFVEGICPHCGSKARGDQCDNCSTLLDPLELKERRCKNCGNEPVVRKTKQLFFKLSAFQKILEEYLNSAKGWRLNAINMTERYLKEGLRDRAVSRDLPWGIDIPIKGFEDKKLYVWVDAVLGYLTASKHWAQINNKDWKKFWNNSSFAYYVHGKDNIPFHTIILPALLKGAKDYKLPDKIISSEYLTIEGKKLSTSNNWAVWVKDMLQNYNPDAIRYFLIINAPEKRDTDFSWREFVNSNNGELVGAYGNLVNRTLVFIQKYFNNTIPEGNINENILNELTLMYKKCGEKIESGEFKSALEDIFEFVRSMNKYFDAQKPWITVKEDVASCGNVIYNCTEAIANLSNLLEPFLPFSSFKVRRWIGVREASWSYVKAKANQKIEDTRILFDRIDKKVIEYEINKLGK